MFAALDEALAALYPTRRWGERDDDAVISRGGGVPLERAHRLADLLAERLKTQALFRPGSSDELCDYVYVLCFGRSPSLLEVREGLHPASAVWDERGAGAGEALDELHLRIALSSVVPFAAVQQVSLRLEASGDDLLLTESVRSGVFDPLLLPRYQKLVAALAELDVRNIDFGDITVPPEGFDAGEYGARYGGVPAIANYLFYPQPCASVATVVLPAGAERSVV
jgi:hypothetical protein